MQITINVPEIPWGHDNTEPDCTMCHEPISDETSICLPGIRGHIHASADRTCLRAAVLHVEGQAEYAWLRIAEAVAKAPHRHTAAAIRATIQNLSRLAAVGEGR
ncbi:hypothetical protein ACFVFS_05735 [Kitasatospora sp. NPDC057692]|uniref:hypothetical protein n=1 Tax=Kitasatospora sp. NPDC057692 TaxID=3346215 RepID=UPI0036959A28